MRTNAITIILCVLVGCAPSVRTIDGYSENQLTVVEYGQTERAAYLRGGAPAGSTYTENQIVFCAEPPADTASAQAFEFLGKIDLPDPSSLLPTSGTPPTAEDADTEMSPDFGVTAQKTTEPDAEKGNTEDGEAKPAGAEAQQTPSNDSTEAPQSNSTPPEGDIAAAITLANNVVVLAQRTELVEVQRQALYRLCELSANNALDREAVKNLSNEILFTMRVLALGELAGEQGITIPPNLITEALTRSERPLVWDREDKVIVYNPKTGNLQVIEVVSPPSSTPSTTAVTLDAASINVSATISCEQIDQASFDKLQAFAKEAGIDLEKFPEETLIREEIRRNCAAALLNTPQGTTQNP